MHINIQFAFQKLAVKTIKTSDNIWSKKLYVKSDFTRTICALLH